MNYRAKRYESWVHFKFFVKCFPGQLNKPRQCESCNFMLNMKRTLILLIMIGDTSNKKHLLDIETWGLFY